MEGEDWPGSLLELTV